MNDTFSDFEHYTVKLKQCMEGNDSNFQIFCKLYPETSLFEIISIQICHLKMSFCPFIRDCTLREKQAHCSWYYTQDGFAIICSHNKLLMRFVGSDEVQALL